MGLKLPNSYHLCGGHSSKFYIYWGLQQALWNLTSWRSVDSSSWQEDLHNSRPGSGRRYQLLDLTQTPRQPDRLRTTGLVGVELESSPGDQTFFIKTTHNFLEADKSYSLQLFSGRFI